MHKETTEQVVRSRNMGYAKRALEWSVKTVKWIWRNLPIGSIELPLYTRKKKHEFTVCASKAVGFLLILIFFSYFIYQINYFGLVNEVYQILSVFKTNDELSKEYDNIQPSYINNFPQFEIWEADLSAEKNFCPRVDKLGVK